jgi:hypothetical protein
MRKYAASFRKPMARTRKCAVSFRKHGLVQGNVWHVSGNVRLRSAPFFNKGNKPAKKCRIIAFDFDTNCLKIFPV